jgi:hypothetical protein
MLNSTVVTLMVSRKYNDTVVQITLSDNAGNYGESSVLGCINMFGACISDAFEVYESDHLPMSGWGGVAPKVEETRQAEAIIFPTKLARTVTDGKVYYKLHGGNWQKFGVRIWPETIPTDMLEYMGEKSEIPLHANMWKATVVMNDKGQPAKVISLVRVENAKR